MQANGMAATMLHWTENNAACSARWRSEANATPPKSVVIADDRLPADMAYRYACEGTAMLWRGDFQNARQLLQALMRRVNQKPKKASRQAKSPAPPPSMKEAFHLHRQAQARRARILAMLLIPLDADYRIPLRRAPDITHYRLAWQLRRTLVTLDRDYLDDRRFPPGESGGVLVIHAPDERLLSALLGRIDRALFRSAGEDGEAQIIPLPLVGRKMHVHTDWQGEAV